MRFLCSALVLCTAVTLALSIKYPGTWRKHHPHVDDRYMEWATFAVSSQTEGRTNYDTVLQLLTVESQVIAGVDYKIEMTVAESTCKIGQDEYSRERCHPKVDVPYAFCTAVVNYMPWEHSQSIKSFECGKRGHLDVHAPTG